MNDMKVWAHDKPDVGRVFLAYVLWEEEPSVFEMTDNGPVHSTNGWSIYYSGYDGGGGEMDSDLEVKDSTRWWYPPKVPDWGTMCQEERLTAPLDKPTDRLSVLEAAVRAVRDDDEWAWHEAQTGVLRDLYALVPEVEKTVGELLKDGVPAERILEMVGLRTGRDDNGE